MSWIPFLMYAIVTTITPGPNNISAMGFGMRYGLAGTYRFLLGILIGFFLVMMVSAFASGLISAYFPRAFGFLKYGGAAYILWLSVKIMHTEKFRDDQEKDRADRGLVSMKSGIFLQLMNPKVIVYGFTIFSAFIGPTVKEPFALLGYAFFLAALGFSSTLVWAAGGSLFRMFFRNAAYFRIFNICMGLLLAYSAVSLILGEFKGV